MPEDKKIKIYNFVTAKDLTPEELRASKLPDKYLISIWAGFLSETSNHYLAVHVRDHSNGPYILLCGLDKNKSDFEYVEKIVAKETKGKPQNNITEREDDICDVLNLNRITQSRVVTFAKKYGRHFFNVTIPEVHFMNVPISFCKNPGLSLEKLTFEK